MAAAVFAAWVMLLSFAGLKFFHKYPKKVGNKLRVFCILY